MAQFIEFIGNHLLLAVMWAVTLGAIVLYHRRAGSSAVAPQEAVRLMNRENAVVLDVRERKEFDAGHIIDSVHIPFAKLKQRMKDLGKHKEKPVVVVCKMGQQAGAAAKLLQDAGHGKVYRLSGGVAEWKAQSLPLVQK